ncbi:MAG: AAA family ATPase [Thermoflexaceae bacterium]|nr:AAA family ATPase [Thermoflexaceae bacterium]
MSTSPNGVSAPVGSAVTELPADRVRARIDLALLPSSTAEIAPLTSVSGQSRAQEAIRFGLGIPAEGYNIAVSGESASGRGTAVRLLVNEFAAKRDSAPDWIYLYNFTDPLRPRAASLPAGMGAQLQRDLARLADLCRKEIPRAFESDSYQERSHTTLEPLEKERDRAIEEMQRSASLQGFAVNVTPMGFAILPLGQDGRPISPDVIAGLPPDIRQSLQARSEGVEELVAATLREIRGLDARGHEAMEALDRDVARFVTGHAIDDLRARYSAYGMESHIAEIEADILANLERFKQLSSAALREMPPQLVAQVTAEREEVLRRYGVNLFVTTQDGHPGAPVIEERNPTYQNIAGRIDYEAHFGALTTDFTHLRPGALHRANGGYLILQIEDLAADPRAWLMLKRTMKTRELRVEGLSDLLFTLPSVNLSPAAIPFSAKVILIGEPATIALLELVDPDFPQLFKIRAEFEPDVVLDADAARSYAAFASRICESAALPPLDREAIAELLQYGARLAERNDRVSTRYGAIGDLVREAAHVALMRGAAIASGADVAAAVRGRGDRAGLIPDRLRRMISEGTLRVDTEGACVGQLNGLAVYSVGAHEFGTPLRISCRVGIGRRGVVAIEREVERSGAIHSKGVLVLSGYLSGTFGRSRPLAFSASLTFEQSYDEVEGDSASSAELYAILCSLADVPMRQDVAVTGSVDQFGRIQAVGGVTEKVEGFFDLCRDRGLTGTQGVIIPAVNAVDLCVRTDVQEAIAAGQFHIWPVTRVEEGLAVLTGLPAGEPQAFGTYPEGTLFRMVSDALNAMHQAISASPATE